MTAQKRKISIAIHGGAGTLLKGMMTPEKEAEYRSALKDALESGYRYLESGRSALDAVELAVKILEDSPLFNAGKGSVFTSEGKHEMDASIMDGKSLKAGAVALVYGVRNPVTLARAVMDNTDHVFLAGEGAMKFARELGFHEDTDEYFYDAYRYEQWQEIRHSDTFQLDHSAKKDSKFGTVGAVACDLNGDLAAATSTGGMTNKRYGRIGDSPLIGSGNYANNLSCAVSCTGSGEYFIRGVVAYDLSALIEHKGMTLEAAAKEVVHKRMPELGGDGGLIAVDSNGVITMPFNTEGMYRAAMNSSGMADIAIYKD